MWSHLLYGHGSRVYVEGGDVDEHMSWPFSVGIFIERGVLVCLCAPVCLCARWRGRQHAAYENI